MWEEFSSSGKSVKNTELLGEAGGCSGQQIQPVSERTSTQEYVPFKQSFKDTVPRGMGRVQGEHRRWLALESSCSGLDKNGLHRLMYLNA